MRKAVLMISSSTRFKRVAFVVALVAAIVVGIVAGGVVNNADAAGCKPSIKTSRTLIAGVYYYDMSASACSLRVLYDKYGEQSGYMGVASLVTGWIPTGPTRAIAGYLGTMSAARFFTQGVIGKCTKNFTQGATLTFVNGGLIGCK